MSSREDAKYIQKLESDLRYAHARIQELEDMLAALPRWRLRLPGGGFWSTALGCVVSRKEATTYSSKEEAVRDRRRLSEAHAGTNRGGVIALLKPSDR